MIMLYLYLGVIVFHFGALFKLSFYAGPDRSNAMFVPKAILHSRFVRRGLALALTAPIVFTVITMTGHMGIGTILATLLIVADVLLMGKALREFIRIERAAATNAPEIGSVG